MKTTFIKFSSLVAVAACTLSACQDYDPFDYETVQKATVAREFAQNFEARYGKIDPNHNWGFDVMPAFSSSLTRATIDVNLNQWVGKYANIPGYPFLNGEYIQVRVNNPADGARPYTIKPASDKDLSNDYPYGDVTDDEIQYVSTWFRTNREGSATFNAAKVNLNISEFFIQNISADSDQEDYPSGANKTTITYKDGTSESCNFYVDELKCMEIGGVSKNADGNGWVHINNFNAGNTNQNPDVDTDTKWRQLKLVTSGGTQDFACKVSHSTGTQWIYDWVLVKLNWSETYNGNTYNREGYYLAFDYSTHKDSKYERDGYYSNWILKITPAFYQASTFVRRIMCEDLGNTHDFDFNDVVFDVAFEDNDAVITLQAAGGTMPIYVGVKDEAHEAHKLLNNNASSTPVNVKESTKSEPAIYRIANVRTTDPDEIKVYVHNTLENSDYEIAEANRGNLTNYNGGSKTEKGQLGYSAAPQKFCVPTTVRWMKESMQIESAYSKFASWVTDSEFLEDRKPWYHNDFVSAANLWNNGNGFTGEVTYTPPTSGGQTTAPEHILSLVTYNSELCESLSGAGYYKDGDPVTVTAVAKSGYKFSHWCFQNTNVTLSTDNPCTFEYSSATMGNMGPLVAYFVADEGSTPEDELDGQNLDDNDGLITNVTTGTTFSDLVIGNTYTFTVELTTSQTYVRFGYGKEYSSQYEINNYTSTTWIFDVEIEKEGFMVQLMNEGTVKSISIVQKA